MKNCHSSTAAALFSLSRPGVMDPCVRRDDLLSVCARTPSHQRGKIPPNAIALPHRVADVLSSWREIFGQFLGSGGIGDDRRRADQLACRNMPLFPELSPAQAGTAGGGLCKRNSTCETCSLWYPCWYPCSSPAPRRHLPRAAREHRRSRAPAPGTPRVFAASNSATITRCNSVCSRTGPSSAPHVRKSSRATACSTSRAARAAPEN
jgi:hypothetical protein